MIFNGSDTGITAVTLRLKYAEAEPLEFSDTNEHPFTIHLKVINKKVGRVHLPIDTKFSKTVRAGALTGIPHVTIYQFRTSLWHCEIYGKHDLCWCITIQRNHEHSHDCF